MPGSIRSLMNDSAEPNLLTLIFQLRLAASNVSGPHLILRLLTDVRFWHGPVIGQYSEISSHYGRTDTARDSLGVSQPCNLPAFATREQIGIEYQQGSDP